jgi:hypothetical protein
MLGNPQTFLNGDKSVTSNASVDFSIDLSTLSHNDSSAAASKLASNEGSEVTLAVGRFSRHIYAKVIFNYLHVSRNFIVK